MTTIENCNYCLSVRFWNHRSCNFFDPSREHACLAQTPAKNTLLPKLNLLFSDIKRGKIAISISKTVPHNRNTSAVEKEEPDEEHVD